MSSIVDLCNAALDKVGSPPILDIEGTNKAERLCKRTYPFARKRVLRKHPWNFAIKRAALSKLTATPLSGNFAYQFRMPNDSLRLLEVLDAYENEYVQEGDVILSNQETLSIRYVWDVTDLSKYDPLAYDAVKLAMAIDMIETLNQSTSKKRALGQEYSDMFLDAKQVDAQENPTTTLDDEEDAWLTARM